MNRFSARTFGETSWAVCCVYLIASLCYLALPWTGYMFSALIFLLAIVLAGLNWQRGPVLIMATLSALVWNFFFIPPKFTLHIEKPTDGIMFAMFFLVALSMGHLTSRLHHREESLDRQQRETQALLEVLQNSVRSLDASGGFDAAVEAMKQVIGSDIAVLLCSSTGNLALDTHASSRFHPTEEEWKAVHWCALHGKPAGRHMESFSELETSWLPIRSESERIGVVGFLWQEDSEPDFLTRRMMEALALQLALLIERHRIADNQRKTALLLESERLHKILFDSVSHELKTPLAVIRSALEELDTQIPLVGEIRTASLRLQRIVEHFLEMSRLDSERLSPRYDWIDFRDVIDSARRMLGPEWPSQVEVHPNTDSLPLVRIDSRLTAQALANIVHNAAVHSKRQAPVAIHARWEQDELSLTVRDFGPGLPLGAEEKVFEKFFRAPGAPPGGTGLGLAIARGFIRAQKGDVLARNHPEGGAEFEIRIPAPNHPVTMEGDDA